MTPPLRANRGGEAARERGDGHDVWPAAGGRHGAQARGSQNGPGRRGRPRPERGTALPRPRPIARAGRDLKTHHWRMCDCISQGLLSCTYLKVPLSRSGS